MAQLIDTHCHLNFPQFAEDRASFIARAHENGVEKMITICTKTSEADEIREIAEDNENIFHTVGVHPHEAENEAELSAEELVSLAKQGNKCVGIGETGLDFYYENSDRQVQEKLFIEHIKAGKELDLPVIIHSRDADDDMARIIKEHAPFRAVLHCFTASAELAKTALEHGIYISISGIITFKNAADLRETVKNVPLDMLLVETDAPYLAPVPHRGQTNEPSFVRHTAEFLAELKEVSFNELAEITSANARKLFSKLPG